MKYLTIKIHNSYFHDAHEHFYTTHDATDIDFFFFWLSLQKKNQMDYFCAKGEIYNINTWNNVMYYWLLKIVLLLSALNQLIDSVFTLICQGNNITSCPPVHYIILVIFTSSSLAVRRDDLSWLPTWSEHFI